MGRASLTETDLCVDRPHPNPSPEGEGLKSPAAGACGLASIRHALAVVAGFGLVGPAAVDEAAIADDLAGPARGFRRRLAFGLGRIDFVRRRQGDGRHGGTCRKKRNGHEVLHANSLSLLVR